MIEKYKLHIKCPLCMKELIREIDLDIRDGPSHVYCENNHKFVSYPRGGCDTLYKVEETFLDWSYKYEWLNDTWLKTTVNTDKI